MSTPDDTTIPPLRRCKRCGEEFPATTEYFYAAPRGLRGKCKACYNAEQQTHYSEDSEFRQERIDYARDYRKRDGVQEHRNEYERNRRRRPDVKAKIQQYTKRYADRRNELRQDPARAEKRKVYHRTEHARLLSRVREANRRTRLKLTGGKHDANDIKLLVRSQTDKSGRLRCWWCGDVIHSIYHVDHRVPPKHGGASDPRNLCIAHVRCNCSKNDKMPHEWNGRLL